MLNPARLRTEELHNKPIVESVAPPQYCCCAAYTVCVSKPSYSHYCFVQPLTIVTIMKDKAHPAFPTWQNLPEILGFSWIQPHKRFFQKKKAKCRQQCGEFDGVSGARIQCAYAYYGVRKWLAAYKPGPFVQYICTFVSCQSPCGCGGKSRVLGKFRLTFSIFKSLLNA